MIKKEVFCMKHKTFAAINVGSYELTMKIFEMSKSGELREIDSIRHGTEFGTDTYVKGKLNYERIDELCKVLGEFITIMRTYRVVDYKAYGTSALRETKNTLIILSQIKLRTGIDVTVLSNSEQRFLDYKSIATKGEKFNSFMDEGTAIVDIGGGSIQISLFDKDCLISTQNIQLGVLKLREMILKYKPKTYEVEGLVEEMISNQLALFKKLFLKDKVIENIIVVDDYLSLILNKEESGVRESGYADLEILNQLLLTFKNKKTDELIKIFHIPEENLYLVYLSMILMRHLIQMLEAKLIWAPGVTLCDGIAYEYAEQNKIFVCKHDFNRDILASAKNISKRYLGNKKRAESLERIALIMFDKMKRTHGLTSRERLLLQLAAILNDCGKYISLSEIGNCSYGIIMATEIIGISHLEREIVANVVKFKEEEFCYYEVLSINSSINIESYLVIAKLTAILRVASALDCSHKQKYNDISIAIKEKEFIISVDPVENIVLERGLIRENSDFFEEIFSIRPVLKQRKGKRE